MLILGAVVVFGIVSVSFAGGLHGAMTTMQQQKVNTALAGQAAAIAVKEAGRGYPVVSALPASTEMTLTVGKSEVPALRLVTVNAAEQTAEVTIRAGRYIGGGFAKPADCADSKDANCISASEIAISSLSQTVPDTEGVTLLDQALNVPASTEIVWKDIAVGAETVVAIDSAGALWSWGANRAGEAGQGSTATIATPTKIDGLDVAFRQVAAGTSTMYALDVDGHLWAWGADNVGQLGNGSAAAVNKPTKIAPTQAWKAVSASAAHACGVTDAGALMCWGAGAGKWRSSTANATSPTAVLAAGDTAGAATNVQFTTVATGGTHQIALDTAGDIYTWGAGDRGQLGNGGTAALAQPTKVTSAKITAAVTDIAASTGASYAVDSYGRLYAWGAGTAGQIGDGEKTDRREPVRVASNILFRDVSASADNGYGTSRDGVAYAWGAGAAGNIGDGATAERTSPTQVADDAAFMKIVAPTDASGVATSVWALDTTHRLWAWGSAAAGTWGDGTTSASVRPDAQQNRIRSGGGVTPTEIAAGTNHTVALGADGTVWSWGANTSGQLGNGGTTASASSVNAAATYTDQPVSVTAGTGFILTSGKLGRVVGAGTAASGELAAGTTSRNAPAAAGTGEYSSLASGGSHTVAIERMGGKVVAWGKNTYGQVGNGTTTNATAPVAVKGLPSTQIVEIAAGSLFSVALDADGNVWAWGRNEYGQLGNGTTDDSTTAVKVPFEVKIVTIGAGDNHALAVDETGATWTWGNNTDGQLGTGSAATKAALPVKITTPEALVKVDGSATASVGISASGKLIAWGGETDNDSGHGTPTKKTATAISSVSGTAFRDIAAAGNQTLAVDADGNLWVWGTDNGGDLGRATVAAPTKLISDKKVVGIATSTTNSVFATSDGKVFVTGAGANGQLGRSSTAAASTFTEVGAWSTATQENVPAYAKSGTTWKGVRFELVDAGGNSTAAIDDEGHLWMWGAGTTGQLGTGDKADKSTPQMVASAANFTDVAVGKSYVVALSADGSVWTFGASSTRANGRSFDLAVPARMPVAAKIAHVDASSNHTVALAAGGKTLYAWGQNTAGQLGIGASSARTLPTIVALASGSDVAAGDGYTLVLDSTSKVTSYGTTPWGAAANPFTGQYADLEASGAVVTGALSTGTNQAQVYGVATAGAAANTLATVSSSMFTNVDAGAGHIVALDVNGTVWTWGSNGDSQLGRTGATGTPGIVPVVGDPARKVFVPQDAPAVATTTWEIATIDEDAAGSVQVNVSAGMPLLSVVVLCEDGSRKQMAKPLTSSGDFSYANITIDDLDGCGAPTLAAILNGAPSSASDVTAVIVPLVYASELTEGW